MEGLKLAPLLTEIKVDTKTFQSQMDEAADLGVSGAEKISDKLSGAAKVGEKLSSAGSTLTKGLTVPIASAGIAAGKMAVDYQTNFAKVSTLLDSNIVDYDKYKDEILNASSESKVAVGEFSEAVYGSISAGVDQTKAIGFTTDAMKLAKGGFTDGAKAVDVLTTAINGYGMEADDASKISDMLITTQNLGKTTVDELASSMGAVIPVASSVNFGMDELSASYAQLTKNGIATSESGTYLKSMLSELGKSGSLTDKALRELTGKGFAELKAEGTSTSDILAMLDQYAQDNGKSLKDMFGSVEAGSAALVLAKGDGTEYNEMLSAMQGSAGATQEAFDKMDATPAEKLKGALNELKNDAIKLGEAFIPLVEKAADKLSDLAEWFGNLSEEQQTNIVKWGAVLAAAGPVLKVLGGGITTFTKFSGAIGGATKALGVAGSGSAASGLVGGFGTLSAAAAPAALAVAGVGAGIYAVHEHSELMNSTALKSREEMSLLEKVFADTAGITTYTKEELEELGFVHKDFGENISPEFQKAVEESTQDVKDFNLELQETGFDNVLTEEEQASLSTKVDAALTGAINTINGRREEVQTSLSETFEADGVVDMDEQTLLEYYQKKYDTSIQEEQKLKEEIDAILQKAVEEKRELNDQEIKDLESKYERMHQIELEALGGTQEEILYAKNEFAARVKTMTLEEASDLLQEKAKARDDEIAQISAGYDTQIQLHKNELGKMNDIDRAAAERVIRQLESDKDYKIRMKEQEYADYVKVVQDGNENALAEINRYSGEILTREEQTSYEQLQSWKKRYDGIEQITEDGMYTIYDKVKGQNAQIVVDVDEHTKEIIGLHENLDGYTWAYSRDIATALEKMAEDNKGSYEKIVGSMFYYNENTNQVVDGSSDTVYSLSNVTTEADGTRTAFINLNGTPVEIQIHENGSISVLNNIRDAANEIPEERFVNVYSRYIDNSDFSLLAPPPGFSYNGLDNVPYDGYHAYLHKGERVLTAEENKQYSAPSQQQMPETITVMLNVGNRELKRVVVPIVNEGLSELNDRERRR